MATSATASAAKMPEHHNNLTAGHNSSKSRSQQQQKAVVSKSVRLCYCMHQLNSDDIGVAQLQCSLLTHCTPVLLTETCTHRAHWHCRYLLPNSETCAGSSSSSRCSSNITSTTDAVANAATSLRSNPALCTQEVPQRLHGSSSPSTASGERCLSGASTSVLLLYDQKRCTVTQLTISMCIRTRSREGCNSSGSSIGSSGSAAMLICSA
eukprot:6620-Heterococcus_DN1.PRE.2